MMMLAGPAITMISVRNTISRKRTRLRVTLSSNNGGSGGKSTTPPKSAGLRVPDSPRVTHSVEIDVHSPANTQSTLQAPGNVVLQNTIPEGQSTEDVILVDNTDGLPVDWEGAVALPLEDSQPAEALAQNVECADLTRHPGSSSLGEASRMDLNEMSHFYANDYSMVSLHSAPLDSEHLGDRVYLQRSSSDVSSSSKRKTCSESSPPHLPAAKRTPLSPSQRPKPVRQSFADICLRPMRALRSRGPAPQVPNIPFPVESQAYRRALEGVLEDESSTSQNNVLPPDVPRD